MSTYALTEPELPMTAESMTDEPMTPELPMTMDDFAALEHRVLRMVDLLKAERHARAEAERKAAELHQALESQAADFVRADEELSTFKREREEVRTRVERLLKQLDEISA
jgi:septal ring factor EnvC (AmiA/AmiB activator)